MSYIRFNNGIWEVENKENLHRTIKIYSELEKYKRKRYNKLFHECEEELRKKYEIESQGNQTLYKVNPKTKIKWDLYNIQKDKIIIIGLIINIFTIQKDCELEAIKIEDIVNYANKDFKNILKSININSKKEVKESLKGILDLILLDSLENIDYNENFRIDEYYINEYTTLNSTDLMEKIKRVSEDNIKPKLERKRDRQIIGLINAYYLAEYSDENKLVKCECCGATTFLKPNNEPYLEYHHLIPFNIADGPDHYENIVGICPMCHTKIHYAIDSEKIMVYKEFNSNNHLHEDLFTRMKKLYKINVLKSYQLEYALVENMINEEEYQKILS